MYWVYYKCVQRISRIIKQISRHIAFASCGNLSVVVGRLHRRRHRISSLQNLFQLTYHFVPTSSRVMIFATQGFTTDVKAWKKVYLQLSDVFLVVGRDHQAAE